MFLTCSKGIPLEQVKSPNLLTKQKIKNMKKDLIFLLLCTIIATSLTAQNQKRDTVVLSLYNNNERYMLYPMPFGKDKPDNDFVAEMVVSLDTIVLLKADSKKDSTGKFPKRWLTERTCGKVPLNVKGKVALLNINAECDISTQVLNAQEAGALAVIVIHTTNSKDSVTLPKKSNTVNYDNDSKVKIPCFTVRKEIGMTLMQLTPSLVGMIKPKADIPTTQSLHTANDSLFSTVQLTVQKNSIDALANTELDKNTPNQNQSFNRIGWEVSPNPATSEAILNYNFSSTSMLIIEVFNEVGQTVTNYNISNAQTGKLVINVSSWQAGAYNVRMITNKTREIKRFVVTH